MLKSSDRNYSRGLSVVNTQNKQFTLEFEPGLTERYRNVRDVVAAGVYQRGLKRVAGDLDIAPGNLSCMLNDDSQRKLGTDDLENYIQTQRDLTPIHYLIARYLGDQAGTEAATLKRVENLLSEVTALIGQAPIKKQRK
jgi:hypothetical protein